MILWSPTECELGEGARWIGDRLVFTDILAGRLLAVPGDRPAQADEQPVEQAVEVVRVDEPLGAVAPVAGRPGLWVAAAGTGIALLDEATGRLDWFDRPAGPAARMNDACCDPAGRLWAIPNGPAFTADGRTMYLADTAERRIDVHAVDPVTGELGEPAEFALVPDGGPDGMTVDSDGFLWVAIWGAGAVHRYRSDGRLDRVIAVPTPQPTSVAFGGPGCTRLFVTSAAYGLTPIPSGAGALYAADGAGHGRPAQQFVLT